MSRYWALWKHISRLCRRLIFFIFFLGVNAPPLKETTFLDFQFFLLFNLFYFRWEVSKFAIWLEESSFVIKLETEKGQTFCSSSCRNTWNKLQFLSRSSKAGSIMVGRKRLIKIWTLYFVYCHHIFMERFFNKQENMFIYYGCRKLDEK